MRRWQSSVWVQARVDWSGRSWVWLGWVALSFTFLLFSPFWKWLGIPMAPIFGKASRWASWDSWGFGVHKGCRLPKDSGSISWDCFLGPTLTCIFQKILETFCWAFCLASISLTKQATYKNHGLCHLALTKTVKLSQQAMRPKAYSDSKKKTQAGHRGVSLCKSSSSG